MTKHWSGAQWDLFEEPPQRDTVSDDFASAAAICEGRSLQCIRYLRFLVCSSKPNGLLAQS